MAWTDPQTFGVNETPLTSTKLNTNIRDNMRELWHEVAYVEVAVDVTTSVAEASAVDVVSSGAITYVANPIIIEFFAIGITAGGQLNLWDGTTDLGRLISTSASLGGPVCLKRRLTPTAASHTYKIRLWANSGGASDTVFAGAGGAGTNLPGYIRILQKGGP